MPRTKRKRIPLPRLACPVCGDVMLVRRSAGGVRTHRCWKWPDCKGKKKTFRRSSGEE